MTVTRAAIQTPTPGATTTTFQVMTYNPLTDAHTLVLDLNDHAAFTMHNKGMKMAMPPKEDSRSFNLRTPGERVVREQYKNRHITYTCWLRDTTPNDANSTTALLASIRSLLAAINNPPYELRIALPKAAKFSYADVVKVTHDIPSDPQQILAQAITHVTIDFECLPGLRGDRLVLQNLVMNPGFEAPSGPAVTAFSDSFATFNAYTVQAGGALAADLTRYTDVILADAPLRYYRCDEASGTVANDVMGNGNGTWSGVSAYGVAGALAGDTDTAVTLNGTSGRLLVANTTGLPTGTNPPASLEKWVKLPSLPAATAVVAMLGHFGATNGVLEIIVNTTGTAQAAVGGVASTTAGAALSLNVWHHLLVTYDGTNLRLLVDGALYGGPTASTFTPSYVGGNGAAFGATDTGADFLTGSMDECAIYGTALSATRALAHYNAGHVAPAANLGNSMVVPSGGRVSFGSPAWSALNLWQTRFRFNSGATATFYLHYTDASNYLAAVVTQTTLTLNQVVAGTTHQLGQTTGLSLVPGAWYWLQATQFPALNVGSDSAFPSTAQAQLFVDSTGTVGSSLASLLGPFSTFDGVTALIGQPQIAASGATLPLGGVSAGHTLALFGPGGWTFSGLNNSATGVASLAWDGARPEMGMSGTGGGNTYTGGPVTSFGAARLDLAAAGTVDAQVRLYTGGTPTGTFAIPVNAATDVLGISAWVKSSAGFGAGATLTLLVTEYDASGTQLRQNTAATLTGPHTSWTQLSANYTTGASCAFVDVAPRVLDTSAGSVGQTVWWDNVQVYDQTTTGQTSMPFCALRFTNGVGQLLVSGIVGDMAAPAFYAIGGALPNDWAGSTATVWIGRSPTYQPKARWLDMAAPFQFITPTQKPVLDVTMWGGWRNQESAGHPASALHLAQLGYNWGTFHVMSRVTQTSTATATVQSSAQTNDQWGNLVNQTNGATITASFTANTPTIVDAGQVIQPPNALNSMAPGTSGDQDIYLNWTTSATTYHNWMALLPIDGELGIAVFNAGGLVFMATGQWLWVYLDGLATGQGFSPSLSTSIESTALPNPAAGLGGPGVLTPSMRGTADPYLSVDPALTANQMLVVMTDDAGDDFPVACEIAYAPLYLYLR